MDLFFYPSGSWTGTQAPNPGNGDQRRAGEFSGETRYGRINQIRQGRCERRSTSVARGTYTNVENQHRETMKDNSNNYCSISSKKKGVPLNLILLCFYNLASTWPRWKSIFSNKISSNCNTHFEDKCIFFSDSHAAVFKLARIRSQIDRDSGECGESSTDRLQSTSQGKDLLTSSENNIPLEFDLVVIRGVSVTPNDVKNSRSFYLYHDLLWMDSAAHLCSSVAKVVKR